MIRKSELSKTVKIGILCGGDSKESAISRRSGRAVARALQQAGYRTCLLDPKNKKAFRRRLAQIEVAFIALHGRGGEDGTIQRLLEQKGIPYVGSGPQASFRAFDKLRAKQCFRRNRLSTPPFTVLSGRGWKRRVAGLRRSLFLKPFQEGSSIGVFPVKDWERSNGRIQKALSKQKVLLAEEWIRGREFTVGVLGKKALPVIELKPKRSFYDYKSKYTRGMTRYLVPAPIPRPQAAQLQRLSLRAHRMLGLRDFSRVDIMTDSKGRAFVLEVNSIPGLTEMSLVPKAARAAGISFPQFCEQLVTWAYRRKGKGYGKKKKT